MFRCWCGQLAIQKFGSCQYCLRPLPAILLVALILVAYYDMVVAGVAAHPGMGSSLGVNWCQFA